MKANIKDSQDFFIFSSDFCCPDTIFLHLHQVSYKALSLFWATQCWPDLPEYKKLC